jgi:hypothetical protein
MKILILSNWSSKIAELNDLTEPNKAAYAKLHGYEFENIKAQYCDELHVSFLQLLSERLEAFDVVMTIGCDAVFVNTSIKIEDQILRSCGEIDPRVRLAKDLTCCWPIQINNDVMIWPKGGHSYALIYRLIEDAPIWIKYPQLWQNHLWNLIQPSGGFADHVKLVAPRLMNSTFQPMTRQVIENADGNKSSRLTRIPGQSSYCLGDWIFHALDMPLGDRLQVMKWALQYVGDGSWTPDKGEIAGRVEL